MIKEEISRLRAIINEEAQVCTCLLSMDTCRHCKLEAKLQELASQLPEDKPADDRDDPFNLRHNDW